MAGFTQILKQSLGNQLYIVLPAYTSRMNRNGEHFKCLRCGYEEDADIVGARNVLMRLTRELIVPLPAKPRPVEYFSMG